MDRAAAVRVSQVLMGADTVYDSGSYCSGDRAYRRCIRSQYSYRKRLRERSRSASYVVGRWAGLLLWPDWSAVLR